MATGMCFGCGRRLYDAMGKATIGVTRVYGDTEVRLHKNCAKTFDRDNHHYTAQITTTSDGHVLTEPATGAIPFKLHVHKKPGEYE